MRKRPGIIQGTSSRDLAEHAAGYSGNGESAHTRRVSRPVEHGLSRSDIERLLHRARVRASHHAERVVRQRAGEDARHYEAMLRRIGGTND